MRTREAILDQLAIAAGQNTKQRDYWLKQLSGDLEKSSFPYDFKESAPGELRDGNHTLNFTITGDLFLKLIKLSSASDHMLHMILAAGWVVLLDKYTFNGSGDITVGSPIYRQEHESTGRWINTVLPLRHRLTPGMTFKELLLQTRETIVRATEHYSYPMEILAEQLGLASPGTDFSLFDLAILVENIHDKNDLAHLRLEMTTSFLRTDEDIRGKMEYNTAFYRESTVEWIIKHFLHLMAAALTEVNRDIRQLSILSPAEKSQILYEFNAAGEKYPDTPEETIHRRFERQVLQTPAQPALEYAGNELTYHQLNQQANRLAYYLRSKGVKPQGVVGMMMTPCIDMIVGILGILKAGGAYLPIDPTYPQIRILKILNDSGASLLLTKSKELDRAAFTTFKQFGVDDITLQNNGPGEQRNPGIIFMDNPAGTLDPFPVENPPHVNQSRDLLYLISTSGSTGEPKSVMLEHRNMLNLLKFEFSEMGIDFSRGILQFASIGFDVAAQEIFSALLSGGKLWLMDRDLKGDILRLFDFIRENKISVVFWPPAFLNLVFSEAMYVDAFPGTITHIIAAGEQLLVSQSIKEYLAAHHVYLVNNYGPAETHVVTSLTIDPSQNIPGRPSIGKPISNTAIYILDKNKNMQPIGVIGELHIAGANVGRGYLNRVELTAERFIYRSYRSNKSYIYQTGDLARWLPDGNIEFIGRRDHQVKIRGFRVEMEEIENHLMGIPGIKEAVVIEKKDDAGDNYLCTYLVPEKGIDIDETQLRTILSHSLPGFMIPAYFVPIGGIPLTANGKVDRKALPEPGTTGNRESYNAPRNEIEETLQSIWSALLDVEKHRLSVTADFFQLGGNSLKATILTAKIHKAFNLKITLGEMFKKPTIRDLAKYIEPGRGEDRHTLIKPVEKKEYYALSSTQRRLYILQQMDETTVVYNLPLVVGLEGMVEKDRLEYTFQQLVQRHESFRTSVEIVQGEPVQRVHPDARVEVKVDDKDASLGKDLNAFGGQYPKSQELRAKNCISSFIRPFDLSRAPLLRVGLIKLLHTPAPLRGRPSSIPPTPAALRSHPSQEGTSILTVDMHHIIADGISLRIFTKEFVTLYQSQPLSPLRLQYKDYSQWQTNEEERKAIGKQQEFWLKQFEGEIPVLALPLDFARPAVQRFEGRTVTFEIDKAETAALRRIAAAEGATLFMVLITLYTIFLSKITNQEDIVIGTPVSGRRHTDLEPIIGMFVNTLALRNYPTGEKDFHAFLVETKESMLKAFDNQLYPFEDLVEELGPQVNKDVSRNPLFDVMFVLDDGDTFDIKIPGLQLLSYPYENRTAKFDLTLQAIQLEQGLCFNLEYSTSLFKEETSQRFTGYFKRVVSAVLEDIKKKISAVEIISPAEKKQLLVDFNNTAAQYPTGKTIYELFEEQAEQTPDHVALVGCRETHERNYYMSHLSYMSYISYKELNKKSHQLACLLKEKGVKADTIGAIMGERSIETIIGIFGILKSGAAFLFIDPQYPEERVNYLLKDSKVKLLVNNSNNFSYFTIGEDIDVISIDEVIDKNRPGGNSISPSPLLPFYPSRSSSLAYILYTSGSTGKPKGVIVNHQAVVNLLFALQDLYPFKESDAYLLKTSILFDVSITELFSWFMGAGRVVILGKGGEKDPQMILDSIAGHHITHINFVPSMFQAFLEILNRQNTYKLSWLRYIFLAGEALFPGLVNKFAALNTKTRLENIYGPTECTVYSSKFSLSDWDGTGSIPIGTPLQNMQLHILSKDNHLQPVGIPGELCTAGAGVSRGYLNRPQLTAERFCLRRPGGRFLKKLPPWTPRKNFLLEGLEAPGKNHLQSCSHASMQYHSPTPQYPTTPLPHTPIYQTGDLARWLPNGNIEFLGRMDHQVKIRGYRIELEEIKSQLLNYDKIKDTVVVLAGQEPGDSYLCAYIVSNSPITVQELKEYLSAKLPGYMIPAYFVLLAEIPLTRSGKVDRQALPLPEITNGGEDYQSPRDDCQEKLAEIWSGILKVEKEKISIDANFFKIGGHSLKAAIMAAHIHRTFEVKISLAKIFEIPTIRALAKEIMGSAKTAFVDLARAEKKEYYPLSFNQKRIWYLQQMEQHSSAYNIFGSIDLNDVVEKSLVQKVLNRLAARHESFRTGFKTVDGEWVQFILKEVNVPFQARDLSSLEESKKQEERDRAIEGLWRPSFDLSQPPLFRALLVKLDTRVYEFVISMHHIVSDGWSMEILRDEFHRLYQGYRSGKNIELEPLQLQYSDFARWQHRQLTQPGHREQAIQSWKPRLVKGIPFVNIPGDSSGDPKERTGAAWQFMIDNELKEKIKNLAESTNTTMFMVMFTAYLLLVLRFSDQENVACAIINSGREHVSLHSVMGFFVNSIIFHMQLDPGKPFVNLLRQVNDNTLALFQNQNYPLELVFEQLKMKYPDIPLSFNLLNMQDISLSQELHPFDPHHIDYCQDIKFDMEMYLAEFKNGIAVRLSYKRDLYKHETVKYITGEYIKSLEFFTVNTGKSYQAYRQGGKKISLWTS
jgi:amino acid adenylation domain-containing protein